jgi:serine/threonine protein kinase
MVGVGERVGNYRVERVLAGDPAVEICVGQHLVLPRTAKLKLLRAEVTTERAVEHLREACLLDALHHLGIARVYESGVHGGRAWFAIEHVEAPSLREQMSPGAIDRVDVIALLRDLCEVVEHAYSRGVVHCGIRPERVLLTGRTRGFPLCVADWSDARLHDARLQQYEPSPEAWHYTSPELACGDPIDDRTDVFAIGVIAYQLLTGRLPFDQGILAVVDDGTTQHVPAALHCPGMPPELTNLVDSMLAYDRWDRPSAGEVLADLAWIGDALTTPIHTRPAAAGQLRLRRPRWTPAHHLPSPPRPLEERVFHKLDDD